MGINRQSIVKLEKFYFKLKDFPFNLDATFWILLS